MNPTLAELKRIIANGAKKLEVERWEEAFEDDLRRIIGEYHPTRGEVRLARIILSEIEE